MGKRLTNEEAVCLFKKFDIDGTGEISIDEFSDMGREILKQGCKVIYVKGGRKGKKPKKRGDHCFLTGS